MLFSTELFVQERGRKKTQSPVYDAGVLDFLHVADFRKAAGKQIPPGCLVWRGCGWACKLAARALGYVRESIAWL